MAFKKTERTFYGYSTFHENPDKPGEYVIEKTFDRDPIIERAKLLKELHGDDKELRFEMSIPHTMFMQWIQSGKISPDEWFEAGNGGIAIEPRKLEQLKREYSRLAGN
ncbi:MAG: hypothetical protein ACRCV9_04545 [Burkholderiaceae bacterium]